MVERVRNVIKRDYKRGIKRPGTDHNQILSKCRKKGEKLVNRYPVATDIFDSLPSEDHESLEQHKKALTKEMDKQRPRDTILLQLMKSTYKHRRMNILDGSALVDDVLSTYPALRRQAVVCCALCGCMLLILIMLIIGGARNGANSWEVEC